MSKELEAYSKLLNHLEQSMDKKISELTKSIDKLSDKFDNFQQNASQSNTAIEVLKEKVEKQETRIVDNFQQHKEFYDAFKQTPSKADLKETKDKTESNENDIIRLKTQNKTAYYIFSTIIVILGLLVKLGVL